MFSSNTSQVSSSAANYIEDVFSTYLYTGNSTTGGNQTITNGVNLSANGGMVWIKGRSSAADNVLFDTNRGVGTSGAGNRALSSNLTNAQNLATTYDYLSQFNTNGFRVTQAGATTASRATNYSGVNYTSWTFRKQPKFFDVVTYTGNGANRTIAHNLGSVPGCIIVKRIDIAADWQVYNRSLANTEYLVLNSTAAKATGTTRWNSTTPTSTVFSLGTDTTVNANGNTYVAYIFAHDAGGFGLTGSDNVISCGSYTGNGSATGPSVSLGYEPQWVMIKNASGTGNWNIFDNMRGMAVGADDQYLLANATTAEASADFVSPTATGFQITSTSSQVNTSTSTYIYIAIRRGPMKTPTSGTSVFAPVLETPINGNTTVTAGFPVDLGIAQRRPTAGYNSLVQDRLRGGSTTYWASLFTQQTSAEQTGGIITGLSFQNNTGIVDANYLFNDRGWNDSSIWWLFGRAPGFFDVVCYTGTGANTTISHNLGVAPELMIVKRRDTANAWAVYANNDNTDYLVLNTTAATVDDNTYWNDTSPTSNVFSVGTNNAVNASGSTYVAYLFATCAGVSKVGSYTGTGTTLQVNCGFTGGARFVLIKRTDSTGDWYVWDTARGIISSNDPYLLLNSTAAEVTSTDYIDTYSAGFEISSTAPAAINANGGTFIFLAIA